MLFDCTEDFAYCDRAEVLLKSLYFPHGPLASSAMPGSYELVNKLASPFLYASSNMLGEELSPDPLLCFAVVGLKARAVGCQSDRTGEGTWVGIFIRSCHWFGQSKRGVCLDTGLVVSNEQGLI